MFCLHNWTYCWGSWEIIVYFEARHPSGVRPKSFVETLARRPLGPRGPSVINRVIDLNIMNQPYRTHTWFTLFSKKWCIFLFGFSQANKQLIQTSKKLFTTPWNMKFPLFSLDVFWILDMLDDIYYLISSDFKMI